MARTLVLVSCCIGVLLSLSSRAQAQNRVRVAELSREAESAIDKGLLYLAKTQNGDGSWDNQNPVALTALSLMAFMVKGYFPEREPHGDALSKGIEYMLREVRAGNGFMGKSMYEHGLATLALSEAWGESSRSDEIRDALKKAVAVIVKSQSSQGGWRYHPTGQDQDISVTVMQLVALASAKEAGILVPDQTIERALIYVKRCQNPNGGFGYRSASDTSFARSAAGVTSLMMCGERQSPEVKRGLAYLHRLGDAPFQPGYPWFYYGHYYAVQAMYQAGESEYEDWYPRVRDALLKCQQADGSWTGGVPARTLTIIRTDRNSYCTPMAILILGVPYRFLPIYQR